MGDENLPRLTEMLIRGLASESSFERGQNYYHDGAILEPVRQELELRAQCEGSDYEPYQVSATLTESGIAETSCTCPFSALLVGRSNEELISLIGEMIKLEPELLSLVELSVATEQARQSKPLDLTAYHRQARAALRHGNLRAVEKELGTLLGLAARLEKAGDWSNAGMVYHAILDETVRGYDEMLQEIDEEGDITSLIDEFAAGLSRCLDKSKANNLTRRVWLEALLEAELTDIEIGGIDLAPSAREAVLEQASDEEWAWIEKRVRDAISKSDGWAREELTRFLAEGQNGAGAQVKQRQRVRQGRICSRSSRLLGNSDLLKFNNYRAKKLIIGLGEITHADKR